MVILKGFPDFLNPIPPTDPTAPLLPADHEGFPPPARSRGPGHWPGEVEPVERICVSSRCSWWWYF